MSYYNAETDDIPMQLLPRLIAGEGKRALTLDQTRCLARYDLALVDPCTVNQWARIWNLDVELEHHGEGRLRVVIPLDETKPGTLTWTPSSDIWVDTSCTQEELAPAFMRQNIAMNDDNARDKTGGKRAALELLRAHGLA